MSRDLPKNVPSAVLAAADALLKAGRQFHVDMSIALDTRAAHLDLARKETRRDAAQLTKLAEDLFAWAVALRRALPSQALHERFRTATGDGPSLLIVDHEIALDAVGGIAAGELRTRLELNLFPDHTWLFRRYEWFDGHNVHGGGQLNTVTSLLDLHPKMLRCIHLRVAEGSVWATIEAGFREILAAYKDR